MESSADQSAGVEALRQDPTEEVRSGWFCAAFVIDVFSRLVVVGWQVATSLYTDLGAGRPADDDLEAPAHRCGPCRSSLRRHPRACGSTQRSPEKRDSFAARERKGAADSNAPLTSSTLATCYDKLAITYRAATVLSASIHRRARGLVGEVGLVAVVVLGREVIAGLPGFSTGVPRSLGRWVGFRSLGLAAGARLGRAWSSPFPRARRWAGAGVGVVPRSRSGRGR